MCEEIVQNIPTYYSAPNTGAACVMLMLYSSKAPTNEELAAAKDAAKASLETSGATVAKADETALILAPSTLNDGESLKLKIVANLIKIVPDQNEELANLSALLEE